MKKVNENLTPHQLLRLLTDKDYYRILDLGCGNGYLTRELKLGNVYHLDAKKFDLPNFYQYTMPIRTGFPDKFFDLVMCRRFLHHVPLKSILPEIERLTNTFIAFQEPCSYCFSFYKHLRSFVQMQPLNLHKKHHYKIPNGIYYNKFLWFYKSIAFKLEFSGND